MLSKVLTFCCWTRIPGDIQGAAHTHDASDTVSDRVASQSQELHKVGERTECDIGDASRGLIPDDVQRDFHARPVSEREMGVFGGWHLRVEIGVAFIYVAQSVPKTFMRLNWG